MCKCFSKISFNFIYELRVNTGKQTNNKCQNQRRNIKSNEIKTKRIIYYYVYSFAVKDTRLIAVDSIQKASAKFIFWLVHSIEFDFIAFVFEIRLGNLIKFFWLAIAATKKKTTSLTLRIIRERGRTNIEGNRRKKKTYTTNG